MPKLNKEQITFILVAILLGLSAAFFGMKLAEKYGQKKYVAVYLQTGEIYFGKMRWFPIPAMTNAVLIQRSQDGQLSIDYFKRAVWEPAEPIYFMKDKIVFWTYIEPTSPIVAFIEGRIPQNTTPLQQQSTPTASPTTTPAAR